MDDCYFTIKAAAEIKTKVKGSKFIGRSFLVASKEEADTKLEQLRKKEYTATHHCYAYIALENNNEVFKYSDDGEPNGTAGKPIYDVIKGSGLTKILLVVTRYFGGTKLGTGGLVKAYSEAAKLALEKSGSKENFITERYRLVIDFSLYDILIKSISKLGATPLESDFSDKVKLILEIRKSKSEQLKKEITELSRGKAQIEKIN